MIGMYLAPQKDPEIELGQIEEARRRFKGHILIIGGLNYRKEDNDNRSIAIRTTLHSVGEEREVGDEFWPRKQFQDRNRFECREGDSDEARSR